MSKNQGNRIMPYYQAVDIANRNKLAKELNSLSFEDDDEMNDAEIALGTSFMDKVWNNE